jgi:site-specific DNA-methyltransferase (adenine-specific)
MQVNEALKAKYKYQSDVEQASEYIENFDILETITNVGNDEVFTPVEVCNKVLDMLPTEVWSNPDYKWLNPVDKNGVFHREIALRLDTGLSLWEPDLIKRRKHILQNMLFSIGLTKFTSEVARRTLYYCSVANRADDGLRDKDGHSINGYAIGNGEWFNTYEGNIKNPVTTHQFKKGKCVFCGIREDSKYNDPKQIEHYAYEFIHKKQLLTHLQDRFFEGDRIMKFDIIVGNPPYHLNDGGGSGSSSIPIYNIFVKQAISLNPRYISMIIPSRWFSGGKFLDDFRQMMLTDKRIREIHDYIDIREVFPTVSFDGGVNYFLWDAEHSYECDFYLHKLDGQIIKSKRNLSENGAVDILIRDEISLSILELVNSKGHDSFSKLVSNRNPFGVTNDQLEAITVSKKSDYSILGRFSNQREFRYLKKDYIISKGHDLLMNYKLFVSKADGAAGSIGNPIPARIIGSPVDGNPGDICSETFLAVGPFHDKTNMNNVSSYMKTKFFRFMVGIRKNKNMTSKTYSFVPMLDMNRLWTDSDLYNYFELDKVMIDFIELHIDNLDR